MRFIFRELLFTHRNSKLSFGLRTAEAEAGTRREDTTGSHIHCSMKNTLPLRLVIIVRAKSQTFYRHFECHSGKVTGGFKHINHGCVQEHSETLVTLQFDAGASALPTVESCSSLQNVTTPSFYCHEFTFYSGFF